MEKVSMLCELFEGVLFQAMELLSLSVLVTNGLERAKKEE